MIVAFIGVGVSYFISTEAYKMFEKNKTKNARDLAGYIFVGTFLVLFAFIIIMVLTNIRLQ